MTGKLNAEALKTVIKPSPALLERTKTAISAQSAGPLRRKSAYFLLPAAAAAAVCAAVYVTAGRQPNPPAGVTPGDSTAQTQSASAAQTDAPHSDAVSAAAHSGVSSAAAPTEQSSASEPSTEISASTAPLTLPDLTEPVTTDENPMGSYSSNVTNEIMYDRYYFSSLREMGQNDLVCAVVSGTVTKTRVFSFEGRVYTRATLLVEQCLKGELAPGQEIVFIEYGGAMEGHIWSYNVYRTSEPGDSLVLFLERVTDDFRENALGGEAAYCPAAATQGTFALTFDLYGNGAYRSAGHVFAVPEADPKENAGFQMSDFIEAVQ